MRSPSIDGPKWAPFGTLLWGCLLRNRFVSLLWIRPTDTQGRWKLSVSHAPNMITARASRVLSLLLPLPTAASTHHHGETKETLLRSCSLAPNPTVTG